MSIIKTAEHRALYNKAIENPEHAAKKFWGYTFKEIFKGSDWNVSSEQPPTEEPGDLRRMDLFVERFTRGKWNGIVLVEVKRQSASVRDLQEVESQAFTACCAYLHWHQLKEVFAITAFGPNARIWSYTATQDYLTPYIPNTSGLSAKEEYINADSKAAAALNEGLDFIFKNRSPSKIRNSPPSSPRPKLVLPSNWHFDEVDVIAGPPTFSLQGSTAAYQGDGFEDEDDYDGNIQSATSDMFSSKAAASSALRGNQANDKPSGTGKDDMDVDDIEHAETSEDTPYVTLTRKVVQHKSKKDEVFYCFGDHKTTRDKWKSSTILYGGKIVPCLVYTIKKEKYFTWSLPKSKGEGQS